MFLRVVLFLVCFALISVLPATAADRYASPSGSGSACSTGTPCTLTTALSQAQAGESVILKDGTYTGQTNGRIKTVRSGGVGNPITIVAENMHQAILRPGAPKITLGAVIAICHDNITIRGLEVDGSKLWHILLRMWGADYNLHCAEVAGGSPRQAILNNIMIEENRFLNSGGVFSQIDKIAGLVVRHNFISQTGFSADSCCGEGFYVGQSTTTAPSVVSDVEVYGNTIRGTDANAVDLKNETTDVHIHHNIVEQHLWATQGGRPHACHDTAGCPEPYAGHSTNDGLIIMFSTNSITEDNIFRNNENGYQTWNMWGNANNIVRNNVMMNSKNRSVVRSKDVKALAASQVVNNTYCNMETNNHHVNGTAGITISGNLINQAISVCNAEVERILGEMAALPRFTALGTIDPPTALTLGSITN